MTTTIMRDSIVGDQWIQNAMRSAPLQKVINPETGQPTGDILTGPVRLAFVHLLEPEPMKQGDAKEPKYKCSLLFPPNVDFTPLYEAYYEICALMFPEYYDAQTQRYHGLNSPFNDQSDKLKYTGYTPGCAYMNVSSKFKPAIVDTAHNPIVDPNRLYAGVWAIASLNAYGYGKNPPQPKKGVAFGIQNVMLIGDDTKMAGGGPDAKQTFAGVKVDAPINRPDFAQYRPAPGPAGPPAAAIPGYTAPGGGVAPSHAPAGFTPPVTAGTATHPSGGQPNPPSAPGVTPSPTEDLSWMT